LYTDAGSEFNNSKIVKFMKQHNFLPILLFGSVKAFFAERLIRTLSNLASSMMYNLANFDLFRDIKLLQQNYNENIHSSINTTPSIAVSKIAAAHIWENNSIPKYMIGKDYRFDFKQNKLKIDLKMRNSKYTVLDCVRISTTKSSIFSKSSVTEKFSVELFIVKSIHRPILQWEPITYSLVDLRQRKIEGRFYDFELKRAILPNKLTINSINKYENELFYVTIQSLPSNTSDGIVFKLRQNEIKPKMLSFKARLQYKEYSKNIKKTK
jgi:hypothetical protein